MASGGWEIDTPSREVESACSALMEAMLRREAWVRPGAVIVEREGAISVHCPPSKDRGLLLDLPGPCLVPTGAGIWEQHGDGIVVRPQDQCPHEDALLLELLAQLYSATGKMAWYRSLHPRGALDEHDALTDAIRTVRPGFTTDHSVDGFLATRTLAYRDQPHIMGIADLINHHRQGAPLSVRANYHLVIRAEQPTLTDECFVSYGSWRATALDRALRYGFADASSPVARCVALEVPTESGVVRIGNAGPPPKSLLDPPSIRGDTDNLVVSHLTFNRQRPRDLVTVLTMALTAAGFDHPSHLSLRLIDTAGQHSITQLHRLAAVADDSPHECASTLARAARLEAEVIMAAVNDASDVPVKGF